MKAYKVDCTACESGVFVFAESASKAKAFAHKYTDIHCDYWCEYTHLRAYRLPKLDCEYKPKEFSKQYELDWCNLEDRRLIAKHGYCGGQVWDLQHDEWVDYCADCELKNECPYCKEEEANG